jgi:hypothetical protein
VWECQGLRRGLDSSETVPSYVSATGGRNFTLNFFNFISVECWRDHTDWDISEALESALRAFEGTSLSCKMVWDIAELRAALKVHANFGKHRQISGVRRVSIDFDKD